jgi:hypothetical protein
VANLSLRITTTPTSEPGRTPTTAKALEVSEDGGSERAQGFRELCFVREPGRFRLIVPIVRGCVHERWKSDGPQSTPQGL